MFSSEEKLKFERWLPSNEREAASNAYLMSLVGAIAGLPLPVINLAATLMFYYMNRHRTAFVRFHCLQAALSQVFIIVINSLAVSWMIKVIFTDEEASRLFISYVVTVLLFNFAEYISNIAGAIHARNGKVFSIFFFGTVSYVMLRSQLKAQIDSFPND